MKIIDVRDIVGNEKLATDIFSASTGTVLMAKGTTLKKEYSDKLIALGVEAVRIEDGIDFETEEGRQIKKNVRVQVKKTVKKVLEQHIYKKSDELEKLCKVAENIIEDIMSEDEVIENIANIRQESNDMYGHSINVCSLSTLLAVKMKLSKKETNEIAKGSILHDLGLRYITVPYENVCINEIDKLQQEEYKKHVIYGYDAVKNEKWISENSKNIILYHHERIDGSGFPFGIMDKSISTGVRIVGICDSFDMMMSGIGNKICKTHEAAEYIRINRGKLFDREIANYLLNMVAMYPVGTFVRTNENEIGKVIMQNDDFTDRPVIQIVKDSNGNSVPVPYVKDLLKFLNIFIVDTV